MAKADNFSKVIQHVRFVGRSEGAVKNLRGFKKSHHTLPDAVNPATSGFLAKLCADELAEEAENFFQRTRTALAYKRKDLALDVTSPTATLTAKHFTFELTYALQEKDPASFWLTRSLYEVTNGSLLGTPEFDGVFAEQFHELTFVLTKGAQVEKVIDAIEELPAADEPQLEVSYPSDCRECTLCVPGVEAEVRFTGPELTMAFPRRGSPGELLEAFTAVRAAFALTKSKALAGLLG